MKPTKIFMLLFGAAALSACASPQTSTTANVANAANVANTNSANASATVAAQNLTEVARPQKIVDMMKERGEQDEAKPSIKILEPEDGAIVNDSTVKVKVELGGDLKGYKPMKDMATGMGNHIHLILDNQPYEPFYNAENEFEFRNVSAGEHTLRVFPSRPWHESYKNEGAFQTVKFTVKSAQSNANQTANASANAAANTNASTTVEGKDMPNTSAGAVDFKKPLLTYSRPKGEYKGADAENIMIDFWLANAKLQNDGGEYRARYSVDGGEAKFIDKWQPIWLTGWTNGKHTIKLELVDKAGNVAENGGYNSTTREFTVSR